MDKNTINILRAAGDHYVANHPQWEAGTIERFNPYYEYQDDEHPRISDSKKIDAVTLLLDLIKDSSGERAANSIRATLRFNSEVWPGGPVLLSLDEEKWLFYADLVIIRVLEMMHANPMGGVMTTAETEAEFGLAAGTATKAAQRGMTGAVRRGHDWLIPRTEAQKRWGNK